MYCDRPARTESFRHPVLFLLQGDGADTLSSEIISKRNLGARRLAAKHAHTSILQVYEYTLVITVLLDG